MELTTEEQIKVAFGLKDTAYMRSKVNNGLGFYEIKSDDPEKDIIFNVAFPFTKCIFYCVP